MIKIQDIIDFIGSKRTQYEMENWKHLVKGELNYVPQIDENGELLGFYNEKNLKEGYWEEYEFNGILFSKGLFIDGIRNGYWIHFWSTGTLHSKGNYVNGRKNGYWEYYHIYNSELSSKGKYVNDEKEDKWDYFDKEGNYTHSETY